MALEKDVKVGALAILSILIFVFAYYYMKGTLMHSGNPEYNAIFTNVDKVKKSDKVYLNGVVIGSVSALEFPDINKPDQIKVTFAVDKSLKIPRDSKIQIISTSLMGNMGLTLLRGASTDIIQPGEMIAGIAENGIMAQLGSSIAPLANSGDSLLKNVNTLFDKRQSDNVYIMIGELNKTLASINSAITNLNGVVVSNQKPLHQTMVNFEKMSNSLNAKQQDLNGILASTNETMRNLKDITAKTNQADITGMMKKLDKSLGELNTIMYDMNNGNGSLTKLMKDPDLYNKLNLTVGNANELLVDFKANPKRYVGFSIFGGKK